MPRIAGHFSYFDFVNERQTVEVILNLSYFRTLFRERCSCETGTSKLTLSRNLRSKSQVL